LVPSLDSKASERVVIRLAKRGFVMHNIAFRLFAVVTLAWLCGDWASGQTLKLRPPTGQQPANPAAQAPKATPVPVMMPISVPAGTPIKVALDSEVRVKTVGQAIHAKTIEAVYGFDKLLIPAGTAANGKIVAIDGVPKKVRTLAAINADLSPPRNVQVRFDELVMADGRRVAINTIASPAPDGVLQFVSPTEKHAENIDPQKQKKDQQKKDQQPQGQTEATASHGKTGETVSVDINEAGQEVKRQAKLQWNRLNNQIRALGKVHSLKRMALAQSPVRPQYIAAGTSFDADLLQPLDFGTEELRPEALTSIGAPPPSGTVVHARLVTALNSSSTKKGEEVEALTTQPLIVSDHLILPVGSVIKGSVIQVQPARRLGRNGQLRILFHQVTPPDGVEQKVQASLEGVAVAKGEHLKLDAEGGAQVTTPRTRYLTTAIALALGVTGTSGDRDAGAPGQSLGEAGKAGARGASGFRLIGAVLTIAVHSRVVSGGFGMYGAATSVYYHFLARGRDVVYPKDMAMIIGLGTRDAKPNTRVAPASDAPLSQLQGGSTPEVRGVSSF
jgi:hypothetical protein